MRREPRARPQILSVVLSVRVVRWADGIFEKGRNIRSLVDHPTRLWPPHLELYPARRDRQHHPVIIQGQHVVRGPRQIGVVFVPIERQPAKLSLGEAREVRALRRVEEARVMYAAPTRGLGSHDATERVARQRSRIAATDSSIEEAPGITIVCMGQGSFKPEIPSYDEKHRICDDVRNKYQQTSS